MDFDGLLGNLGLGNNGGSNTIIWIIIAVVILWFGNPGALGGFGGPGGPGYPFGYCVTPAAVSPANVSPIEAGACCYPPNPVGGFGSGQWIFILLIIGLIFFSNRRVIDDEVVATC